MRYRDRADAGAALAERLTGQTGVVLGLVRGGVPVAAAVARTLLLPLDALVVRKLGIPWAPEVAFGALGPGGVKILNELAGRLDPAEIQGVIERETAELRRRGRPTPDVAGRTAILVDDGLATGATAEAAVAVARQLGATRVVLAAPVGAETAVVRLRRIADEVVCPVAETDFGAVGRYYEDFRQLTDADVAALLQR